MIAERTARVTVLAVEDLQRQTDYRKPAEIGVEDLQDQTDCKRIAGSGTEVLAAAGNQKNSRPSATKAWN